MARNLFPKARVIQKRKGTVTFEPDELYPINLDNNNVLYVGNNLRNESIVTLRVAGSFAGKAIVLPRGTVPEIVEDEQGELCLIFKVVE